MLVIVLHSTGQGRIGLNGEPRIAECGSMSFITDPYPTFIKNKKINILLNYKNVVVSQVLGTHWLIC